MLTEAISDDVSRFLRHRDFFAWAEKIARFSNDPKI
jgi:hypothetical protein